MTLGDRLKIARESIGKGQKEMAALCNASYRMWQAYESGENQPKADVIEALVKSGFNANWLLSGEGEMRLESESDRKLRERYPLSPLVANAFGITSDQNGQNGQNEFDWFHKWIDEELAGKSITEVMSIAVKIKAELDRGKDER